MKDIARDPGISIDTVSKVLRNREDIGEETREEEEEISRLLARGLDAIVVASAQWTVESLRRIEERKTPYVLVGRKFAGLAANFVGVDDEVVGAIATEHLIAAGCRRIAYIRGPEVSTALEGMERIQAHPGTPVWSHCQGLFPQSAAAM